MATQEESTIKLNSKGFCVFCLKRRIVLPLPTTTDLPPSPPDGGNSSDSDENLDPNQSGVKLRSQLSRVIGRYLDTNYGFMFKSPTDAKSSDKLNCHGVGTRNVDVGCVCSDCTRLVESINQLFDDMKKLELLLDFEARQLRNIMAFSKRAPTRKKLFQDQFVTDDEKEDLAKVRKFRKGLLKKFSEKFEKIQPKILFQKASQTMDKPPVVDKPEDKLKKRLEDNQPKGLRSQRLVPSSDEAQDPSNFDDDSPPSPLPMDDSAVISIRPLEKLQSPSKSPPSSPRATRSSAKRACSSDKPPNPPSTLVFPPTCKVSTSKASEITELLSRNATLTEWLQKTFPCPCCSKIFITQETLSAHQVTCPPPSSPPSPPDDGEEAPMDVDISQNSPEILDDPLDDNLNVIERTTCTIRILQKQPPPSPPAPSPVAPPALSPAVPPKSLTRYCKYCKKRVSTRGFAIHRISRLHKDNKRTHKKAKKLRNQNSSGPPASIVLSSTPPPMPSPPEPVENPVNGHSEEVPEEDSHPPDTDSVAQVQNVVGVLSEAQTNDILVSDEDD